jgi:hypothetical protein
MGVVRMNGRSEWDDVPLSPSPFLRTEVIASWIASLFCDISPLIYHMIVMWLALYVPHHHLLKVNRHISTTEYFLDGDGKFRPYTVTRDQSNRMPAAILRPRHALTTYMVITWCVTKCKFLTTDSLLGTIEDILQRFNGIFYRIKVSSMASIVTFLLL